MTDVAIYQQPAELAVPGERDTDSWIQVCSDVIKVANVIHDTPFVPEGLRGSAPAVAAAILAGRELGIGPMTALQHIHVIKGKPAQSAALMRALIQSAGHKIETVEITDTRAVVRGQRKGESSWEESRFTADQAKWAGIDLGKYPEDKLYARATSRLARRKFADVIAGMPYSAEELEDGGEGEAAMPAPVADAPAQPKPRTAQRKTRKAHVDQGEQGINLPPAQRSYDGPPMPPLPGEDEPDPTSPPAAASGNPVTSGDAGPATQDEPDPVSPAQLTAIWTLFTKVFAFASDDDDKERARHVCAHVINRAIESTREMSKAEASTVMDTLHLWQDIADKQHVTPRSVLEAEMTAAGGGGE